jgi:hypothetical protein
MSSKFWTLLAWMGMMLLPVTLIAYILCSWTGAVIGAILCIPSLRLWGIRLIPADDCRCGHGKMSHRYVTGVSAIGRWCVEKCSNGYDTCNCNHYKRPSWLRSLRKA